MHKVKRIQKSLLVLSGDTKIDRKCNDLFGVWYKRPKRGPVLALTVGRPRVPARDKGVFSASATTDHAINITLFHHSMNDSIIVIERLM